MGEKVAKTVAFFLFSSFFVRGYFSYIVAYETIKRILNPRFQLRIEGMEHPRLYLIISTALLIASSIFDLAVPISAICLSPRNRKRLLLVSLFFHATIVLACGCSGLYLTGVESKVAHPDTTIRGIFSNSAYCNNSTRPTDANATNLLLAKQGAELEELSTTFSCCLSGNAQCDAKIRAVTSRAALNCTASAAHRPCPARLVSMFRTLLQLNAWTTIIGPALFLLSGLFIYASFEHDARLERARRVTAWQRLTRARLEAEIFKARTEDGEGGGSTTSGRLSTTTANSREN